MVELEIILKKILEIRINALEIWNSGKINKVSKISEYDASENKKKGEYNEGDEMFLSKKKKRYKERVKVIK